MEKNLNEKEKGLLEYEGVENRIRNKLSPFRNIIGLPESYLEISDHIKREKLVVLIKNNYESAKSALEEMINISKEVSNERLEKEIQLLNPLLDLNKSFVESNDPALKKKVAEQILEEYQHYYDLIYRIIELCK